MKTRLNRIVATLWAFALVALLMGWGFPAAVQPGNQVYSSAIHIRPDLTTVGYASFGNSTDGYTASSAGSSAITIGSGGASVIVLIETNSQPTVHVGGTSATQERMESCSVGEVWIYYAATPKAASTSVYVNGSAIKAWVAFEVYHLASSPYDSTADVAGCVTTATQTITESLTFPRGGEIGIMAGFSSASISYSALTVHSPGTQVAALPPTSSTTEISLVADAISPLGLTPSSKSFGQIQCGVTAQWTYVGVPFKLNTPGAPSTFVASADSSHHIHLSWTEPASPTTLNYTVTTFKSYFGTASSVSTGSSSASYVFTSAVSGFVYTFEVYPWGSYGPSAGVLSGGIDPYTTNTTVGGAIFGNSAGSICVQVTTCSTFVHVFTGDGVFVSVGTGGTGKQPTVSIVGSSAPELGGFPASNGPDYYYYGPTPPVGWDEVYANYSSAINIQITSVSVLGLASSPLDTLGNASIATGVGDAGVLTTSSVATASTTDEIQVFASVNENGLGGPSRWTTTASGGSAVVGLGGPGLVVATFYQGAILAKAVGSVGSITTTETTNNKTIATYGSILLLTSPLIVGFTPSPASPATGQLVTFYSSVSGGVQPYSYAWALGGGVTSVLVTPTHTYSAAGNYQIWLNVTDYVGTEIEVHHTLSVSGVPPPPKLGAPTNLAVVGQTSGSISLTWTLPATKVTNVTIWFGVSCLLLKLARSAGNSTKFAVTGLSPVTTYCFSAQAWNGSIRSQNSSTALGTTLSSGGGGGGGGGGNPPIIPPRSVIAIFVPLGLVIAVVGLVFLIAGLSKSASLRKGGGV